MDSTIARMSLYHNLYLACLVATVLFLIISIVLFICLNIKETIGFLSGNQAKREIQRLKIEGVTGKSKEKNHSIRFRKVDDLPKVTVTKNLENRSHNKTELLYVSKEKSFETTLLQRESVEFYTECEIMLVHTNEIIE